MWPINSKAHTESGVNVREQNPTALGIAMFANLKRTSYSATGGDSFSSNWELHCHSPRFSFHEKIMRKWQNLWLELKFELLDLVSRAAPFLKRIRNTNGRRNISNRTREHFSPSQMVQNPFYFSRSFILSAEKFSRVQQFQSRNKFVVWRNNAKPWLILSKDKIMAAV